jgi:hypothetical protein
MICSNEVKRLQKLASKKCITALVAQCSQMGFFLLDESSSECGECCSGSLLTWRC